MGIEIYRIRGDAVELVFNPKHIQLQVGENLCIREKGSGQALIVQVLAFRSLNHPKLLKEQLELAVNGAGSPMMGVNGKGTEAFLPSNEPEHAQQTAARHLNLAVTKIRKMRKGDPTSRWDRWDGWIPSRDVEIERIHHRELADHCIENQGNLLQIGQTLDGETFALEGRSLEKINVITGVKGSGKSYLAKVLLLELMGKGGPCIVFDMNKEYIHLPSLEVEPSTGRVLKTGIIHLKAGGKLKIGVRQFGIAPLLTLLTKFGLPEISALYVENRLHRLFNELQKQEQAGLEPPFLGIDQLLEMAEAREFVDNDVVNNAIRSRLEMVRNTGIFADHADEAISLYEQYQLIRNGGALIIDISDLTNLARFGFVQAIVEIIKHICEREIEQQTNRFPFVFFEEAHLYVSENTISSIVTRSRHLGITCFFVTNMIGGLDEAVLRQVDNLFVMHLPFDDDVQHISKSAMTDKETMASFVKRLRYYHTLILGHATQQYAMIVRVKQLDGVQTAGETKYFFQQVVDRLPLATPGEA